MNGMQSMQGMQSALSVSNLLAILIGVIFLFGIIALIVVLATRKKELPPVPEEMKDKSYFDGSCISYLGFTILSRMVTLVTLGFAYPWMCCMLQRWKARHTIINGKRMYFDGRGVQLIGRYLLWWFLTVITFGIYGLWMGVSIRKWKAKHTHFAGEEDNNSYFDGGVLGFFGIRLVSFLFKLVTFWIARGWANKLVIAWDTRHTVVDSRRLAFVGSGGSLFGKYLLWGLLTVVTFGIYGFFVPVKFCRWQTERTVDHEHTAQALQKQTDYLNQVKTDAVSFKTYRVQKEMERVKAGITDATTKEELEKLADIGVRAAQYEYVVRYSDGAYAAAPFDKYLTDSALQGFAPAMYLYGVSGLGADAEYAREMIRKAAKQGSVEAQRHYLQEILPAALAAKTKGDLGTLEEAIYWFDQLHNCDEPLSETEAANEKQCILLRRKIMSAGGKSKHTVAIVLGVIAGTLVLLGILGTVFGYVFLKRTPVMHGGFHSGDPYFEGNGVVSGNGYWSDSNNGDENVVIGGDTTVSDTLDEETAWALMEVADTDFLLYYFEKFGTVNYSDFVYEDIGDGSAGIECYAVDGINTTADLSQRLSVHFTDAYVQSFIIGNGIGSWHEENGKIYFGQRWGVGQERLVRETMSVEQESDVSYIVCIQGEFENQYTYRIVLENGAYKLDAPAGY